MPQRSFAAFAVLAAAVTLLPAHPASAAPQAMTPLATVTLPDGTESVGSATVAFDGAVLYYMTGNSMAGGPTPGRIERIVLTGAAPRLTAVALPPITLPVPATRIAYDARHRALVAQTIGSTSQRTTVRRYDLRTGRTTTLFTFADTTMLGAAYNWSTDRYTAVSENGLRTYDGKGRTVATCDWDASAGPLAGVASDLVGSGTGDVYEQVEDDSTVYRVGHDCRMLATLVHRTTAEPTSEDDSMACDGVTFATPVIWIRDTATTTMTAYAVPSGACLLPTALSTTSSATRVCATLRRAEVATPIAGQPLALRVDGGPATTVTTGATGVACTAVAVRPGRHVARATYAGSRSWAPAAASGPLVVAAAPPARARTVAPRRGLRRRETFDVADPALPHGGAAAGPPPAQPVAGHQVAAQQGYGNAAVAQALPAGVPVPEAETQPQLAYAMSDLGADRRRSHLPAVQLLGAAVISAVAAGVASRRATAPQRAS